MLHEALWTDDWLAEWCAVDQLERCILTGGYGNDSRALQVFLARERRRGRYLGNVLVVFNDTGWAREGWLDEHVRPGEEYAWSVGFDTIRVPSFGFEFVVMQHQGFPFGGARYCTRELKIWPSLLLFDWVDPRAEATIVLGIRREESAARARWPRHVDLDPRNGGRDVWSPLVTFTADDRDELLRSAGIQPTPHRSGECEPCIASSRGDLRLVSLTSAKRVIQLEKRVGRPMFRARRKQGETGFRSVMEWAHSAPRQHTKGQTSFFVGTGAGCLGSWCRL